MSSTRDLSPSPKRHREDDDEDTSASPPRKRTATSSPSPSRSRTNSPPLATSPTALPSRPAHRPSRSESRENEDSYYHRATPPSPPKPTSLHYTPHLLLTGHKKPISSASFSPSGTLIATASADCTIKIWDAHTGALHHTLSGHLAGISTLAWSPDSTTLASGSDDKTIRLWNTSTGSAHPKPFIGHHNYIYSLAFSPKGNMLVSGSYDEAVFLWDVRSARIMRSLPAHSDPIGGVEFVRDGTLIVSCANDGLIRVWDTATGQCLRTIVHEDNAPVTSVKFSPNGKYILAWTLDSCIRLWDYVEGKGRCVKTYQGHTNKKYSLSGAFGVYGEGRKHAFVASGSEDGSVFLWDVSSKNVLQRLEAHTGAVLSVDTHPSEPLIVSAGMDKTVRVWRCSDVLVNGAENGHREHEGYDDEVELPPYPFA
ncbi:WD40 repeat-like protein [Sporormia fimetaria CBS 119925]|uniref:Mitochondrial division protein 1 n=1 Tax=Sporormia fimetaria CBS 119925 TaxID=1340428 RepID=A0A6A6VCC9_9PLEO|nr:WD40 repeat-like protein [Sporormia fimetaria CBS 119925]